MKYIKTYEMDKRIDIKGYLYINEPKVYGIRSLEKNIVFPEKIIQFDKGGVYNIIGNQIRIVSDKSYYERNTYEQWNQDYYYDEYKKIKFITMYDFYKNNEDFVREHMLKIQNYLDNERYSSTYKIILQGILKSMTIPETEYILQVNNYNL